MDACSSVRKPPASNCSPSPPYGTKKRTSGPYAACRALLPVLPDRHLFGRTKDLVKSKHNTHCVARCRHSQSRARMPPARPSRMRCVKCLSAQASPSPSPIIPQLLSRHVHLTVKNSDGIAGRYCTRWPPTSQRYRALRSPRPPLASCEHWGFCTLAGTARPTFKIASRTAHHGVPPLTCRPQTSALDTLTSCAAPPRLRTSSRVEFSMWVCESHNRVNRLLGKPEFPCTIAKLDARW